MNLRDAIGRGIGGLFSPVFSEGSLIKGARLFHPDGVVYRADVKALVSDGDVGEIAQRLKGAALVRLSGGIWPGKLSERLPDVLGIALRFQSSCEVTPVANAEDQDLLFLSFPHLWELPIAPLLTHSRDFMANDYYAQLPFKAGDLGHVKFRLVPLRAAVAEGNRRQKLACAAAAGLAVLRLEVRKLNAKKSWTSVVDIVLQAEVDVDQDALHFDPFRTGLGIAPIGLLQSTRLAVYKAAFFGRWLGSRGRRK